VTLYRAALRPLLFSLSPDRSHALAHAALRWALPWRILSAFPRLETRFAGVTLPNPVGLAAGFDKDGELVEALSYLGFGFVTVGSIMPQARPGNPFPRLVRYPETRSMADSMGLPSKGRDHALACLKRVTHRPVPVFANVGGFTAAELADSFRAVEPYVDGVEMNLLCPNLPPGETFDELKLLREVLARLQERRKPAIVRVPNTTVQSDERLAELIELCVAGGVAGIKVGGGRPVREARLGTGQGTLHGRAVLEAALGNVARAARLARGRLDIKGNGGVFTADDVRAMQQAGACCVDLFSAFVYEGWSIAADITRGLIRGQAPNST
jgi:dihydroorotate dehydrogenase (fumarate)/dihydroorotate dehydrogenase